MIKFIRGKYCITANHVVPNYDRSEYDYHFTVLSNYFPKKLRGNKCITGKNKRVNRCATSFLYSRSMGIPECDEARFLSYLESKKILIELRRHSFFTPIRENSSIWKNVCLLNTSSHLKDSLNETKIKMLIASDQGYLKVFDKYKLYNNLFIYLFFFSEVFYLVADSYRVSLLADIRDVTFSITQVFKK